VTVFLIAVNLAVFVWQLTLPSDGYSSPEFRRLAVPETDRAVLEYGAIPYRLTHPGDQCAVGVGVGTGQQPHTEVVCEGTVAYDEALALERQGAPFAPLDAVSWWVTLFTSMFMHAGLLHFGFNMLFLWIFGNNVEDSMGRPRFLLFYLLAGVAAAYSQALLDTSGTTPAIGASGAIAGVLGGYLLLYPRARVLTVIFVIFFVTLIEVPATIMLGVWFLLQFIPAVGQFATPDVATSGGGVAYFAHVGGFIFGLAAIRLFANRYRGSPALPV
jgi:membrane associated rhomboid family serine protease